MQFIKRQTHTLLIPIFFFHKGALFQSGKLYEKAM